MFSITDIFKLILDSLKQTAVNAIVETVVERGEGLLSEKILGKIRGLRSDVAFPKQLHAGLQRGLQGFLESWTKAQPAHLNLFGSISGSRTESPTSG